MQNKKANKPREVDVREKEVEDEKRRYAEMERKMREAELRRAKVSNLEEEQLDEALVQPDASEKHGEEICKFQSDKLFP